MITQILTASGLVHRQGRFPRPPDSTYAVWFDDVEIEKADGVPPAGAQLPRVYHHDCTIELYEPKPDDDAEAALESALDAAGAEWSKESRYWLQEVQRYQVIYTFSHTSKS